MSLDNFKYFHINLLTLHHSFSCTTNERCANTAMITIAAPVVNT